MSDKSEEKSVSEEVGYVIEPEAGIKSNYTTRKKQIDFAKIGEKLGLTGSSCHYCKNTMTVQHSNACRNTQKTPSKKKTCNKKFCYDCLQKYFLPYWENRLDKNWMCPCCRNQCSCQQCKKNWIKSNNFKKNMGKEKSHDGSVKNENSPQEKSNRNSSQANSADLGPQVNSFGSSKDVVMQDRQENGVGNVPSSKSSFNDSKFSFFHTKPKIDIVSEKELLGYRRSLEEYYSVLEKYNDYFDKLNIQRMKKIK